MVDEPMTLAPCIKKVETVPSEVAKKLVATIVRQVNSCGRLGETAQR